MLVSLEIGGVVIPQLSAIEIEQEYTEIAARDSSRLADGSAYVRTLHSGKLSTQIKGAGWSQSAIDAIDFDATHVIKCVQARSVYTATTSATLPSARRSDYAPFALAIVGDGLTETSVSMGGDTATITPVSGASGYLVQYYPEFTAVITAYKTGIKTQNAEYSWQLTAEEI